MMTEEREDEKQGRQAWSVEQQHGQEFNHTVPLAITCYAVRRLLEKKEKKEIK